MEYMVVYWPRHLWATASAASSSPTVLCQRLSPHAVCVLSLDATSSAGPESLPAKGSESRRVVLFDAQVVALGSFESLHSPQLLQKIGKTFMCGYNCGKTVAVAPTSATWNILKAMGFYVLYVPLVVLPTVATSFQHLMHNMKTPSWLLAGGGKSLAELSTFLSMLSQQVHNVESLRNRLGYFHCINKNRRLSRQERLELLQICNLVCIILLDLALGRVILAYVITAPHLQISNNSPRVVVDILRSNVEWLMGAPAGFKLNKPLASILGNGILLWLHLWTFLLEQLAVAASRIHLGWWLLQAYKSMGMTLQLTFLADIVSLMTWHSHWVYLYFAKLNRLQFGLFSSLLKLFLGKKTNVLRHRVDTCEYDVGQLLLGTLLFTVLTFLVTTNLVFFVFFAVVRGIIEGISLLLWLPVVALSSLPLASLVYRVWNPSFFIVGMELQTCEGSADIDTIIENVGVGRQSSRLDAQHRNALRQALASWEISNRCNCKDVIFQLVPVTSSFSAQFTRLRTYLQAVGARYSLAIIVNACLFGSTEVAQVPLSVLFGYSE